MNKPIAIAFLAAAVSATGVYTAQARPEYARKENRKCGYCHLNPAGGGARGFRGSFYGANNLSFASFEEEREATIAAVPKDANAAETRPKVNYVGNVVGPASKQIQLASLRAPVLVMFFDNSPSETTRTSAKAAAKLLKGMALAYGRRVAVVGVTPGDSARSLKVTQDLGSVIRVLPDNDGEAAKKFAIQHAFDIVVVSPRGDTAKTFRGYSKANIEAAIALLGVYGVEAPKIDTSTAPDSPVQGGSIGSEG